MMMVSGAVVVALWWGMYCLLLATYYNGLPHRGATL